METSRRGQARHIRLSTYRGKPEECVVNVRFLVCWAQVGGSETLVLRNIQVFDHVMDIRPSLLLHSIPTIKSHSNFH